MQADFHYYATYCAAYLAGYTHKESLEIAYSCQFVDCCTRNFLSRVGGPKSAVTTQSQIELVDANTDMVGLQDITRIWASFHFLPGDLKAPCKGIKKYRNKYRLICKPNGPLVAETVKLASGKGTQAAGIAMHVLADTWAHSYFAGTPSLVINNTNYYFYEMLEGGDDAGSGQPGQREIHFIHSTTAPDDPDTSTYTNSIYQPTENSIMNLGHGRAGHLPDYSYVKYKYLPAWGDYEEIIKDNPHDYFRAFFQMVYALKWLKEGKADFALDSYDGEAAAKYKDEIKAILTRRQTDASADWKAFGEKLSGEIIPDFDTDTYIEEYRAAGHRCDGAANPEDTFLGKFFIGAMAQKSMVTGQIFGSGNILAGLSRDFSKKGFGGIKDFASLVDDSVEAIKNQEK